MEQVFGQTYFGFVYLWYDRKHRRFCLGSHLGSKEDGYTSSTGHMKIAERKRPEDFHRRILYYHPNDDLKELRAVEQLWLNLIKEEELNTRYYNQQRCVVPQNRPTADKKKRTSQSLKKYYETHEPRNKFPTGKGNPSQKQKGTAFAVCSKTGEKIGRVLSSDLRWQTGEIVGLRKGKQSSFRGPRPEQSLRLRGTGNPMFGRVGCANHLNQKSFECSHCKQLFTKGNLARWHGENCRLRD